MEQIPLNHEASAGDTNKQVTSELPPEVVQCLENARFLHLATCMDNVPNVALMNYTYIPSSRFSASPVIVMTTNPASKKTNNLVANPNVSLLVHDWVSHRPPTSARRPSGGSPGPEHRSSLASMLLNLNTSAVSSISATINGAGRLLDAPSSASSAHAAEEEAFYRARHLENNTFVDDASLPANGVAQMLQAQRHAEGQGQAQQDGGAGCFVAGEEVRVIVVTVRDVRISDWKGGVRDWVIVPAGDRAAPVVVNGVR